MKLQKLTVEENLCEDFLISSHHHLKNSEWVMSVGGCFFSEHIFYLNYAVNGSEKLRANSKSVLSSSSGIQLNFSLPSFFCVLNSEQHRNRVYPSSFTLFFIFSCCSLFLRWYSHGIAKKVRSSQSLNFTFCVALSKWHFSFIHSALSSLVLS